MVKEKATPSLFEYDGPKKLKDIEKRILEIEAEKPARLHNLQQDYTGSWDDEEESIDISYLDVEKARLQLQRQFFLDKRENWKARILWNILVPIIVAVLTAYLVTKII